MEGGEIAHFEQFVLSHSVFRRLALHTRKNQGLFGKGLRNIFVYPFPKQGLVFTCLKYMSFESSVGKREIARNEQFLLFPQCFLSIWRNFFLFHQIWNYHLQTLLVWKSLKLSFGKGLNILVIYMTMTIDLKCCKISAFVWPRIDRLGWTVFALSVCPLVCASVCPQKT